MPEPLETVSVSSFELAAGSVIGRDHRVIPKNNQDGWYVARSEHGTVAVICDGCGSGTHSEVGAKLAARIIAETTLRHAYAGAWGLESVRDDVVAYLRVLALQMGRNLFDVVDDYFLFTVVGVSLTGCTARFFSLGDGVYAVNGEVTQLGPFPGNQPPYLGYVLLGEDVSFTVDHDVPLDELESFLIGCDGAGRPGLLQVCEEDPNIPGMRNMTVGPFSQFWTGDWNFSNPAAISRRLKLIARDWPLRNPEHGLLPDDTTIVVGRKIHDAPGQMILDTQRSSVGGSL